MTTLTDSITRRVGDLKSLMQYGDRPAGTGETRRQADAAVEGRLFFRFNGVQEITTGRRDIDWLGNQYPHQEWRCQLRRFFQLRPLAILFEETGDLQYAEAARDYIEDWILSHPTMDGKWSPDSVDSMLDLAIRMGHSHFYGWFDAIAAFAKSGVFDGDFIARMLESMRGQLNYLNDHLTIFGNWRLCEADGLAFASLLWSECPDAAKWRQTGIDVLNEGFLKQVLPDGAQYELTPGYHHWMTSVYHNYWHVGQKHPELGLRIDPDKLAGMFEYGFACYRPDGAFNAWNDSQPFHSNNRPVWEKRWQRFAAASGRSADRPLRGLYPWAKQAAFRDAWTPESCYWTFEAAAGAGTHSHLGRASLQIMEHGIPLVVDPGFLSYEATDPSMALGRSTRAHNTVNLNGWNQSMAPCTVFRHLACPGADLIVSQYDGGYWEGELDWRFTRGTGEGIQAMHHRVVLRLHGTGFLVIDQIVRQLASVPETRIPTMELNWQLTTPEVEIDRAGARACTRQEGGGLLALFPTLDDKTDLRVFCGEKEPLRAWLPCDKGLKPAAQISLSRPLPERYAEWVTLLIPYAGQNPPEAQCRVWRPDPNFVSQAVIEWGDGRSDEISWAHRLIQPIGKIGGLETDAPLVWVRREKENAQAVHFGKMLTTDCQTANVSAADYWA